MKVTAIVGSPRKKHTYGAVEKLIEQLMLLGLEEAEIIMLRDYNLEICKGCIQCFLQGEKYCPLNDDRDIIIKKMNDSDGVIFASPNYSFHVSGQMKIFLDRLGYIFHRPQFFGKSFTSLVAQGIYGGKDIVKYFNFIGKALGFNETKGICITTLEPISEKNKRKNERALLKLSKKFYSNMINKKFPKPSIFDLLIFRMSRTSMKLSLDKDFRDYTYYSEKGWFTSDFYYEIKLNPLKGMLGNLFDFFAKKIA